MIILKTGIGLMILITSGYICYFLFYYTGQLFLGKTPHMSIKITFGLIVYIALSVIIFAAYNIGNAIIN